jgi:thioredoxin reductase (NADPH)
MNEPKTDYEVMVIGGGPAGMAAALWCSRIGVKAAVFEKEQEFGGQLRSIYNPIEDYPGVYAATGSELRDKFLKSTDAINVPFYSDSEIVKADLAQKSVELSNGASYRSKAVMIATGVRRRHLGVPGESEFEGRGVLRSGVEARNEIGGKKVVIVGGGDAAVENALILSEAGAEIILVHRRKELTARTEFVDRLRASSKIELILDSSVSAISGDQRVDSVEILGADGRSRRMIETDAVLIRIGVLPNTELFKNQGILDSSGYLQIKADCSTDIPMVYGLGDAAYPAAPTISTAVGSAAVAVKSAYSLIKASLEV